MGEIVFRIYDKDAYRLVDLNNLKLEDIQIDNIAHVLSLICRFGGNLETLYSVAQHSVIVSHVVEQMYPHYALTALLHDASEAFGLSDFPTPVKTLCPAYVRLELDIQEKIAEKYDLYWPYPDIVKQVDSAVCKCEQSDLQGVAFRLVRIIRQEVIEPVSSLEAEIMFLRRFAELYKKQVA